MRASWCEKFSLVRGRGGIGRRACLRCMYPEGCGGSSPLDRTTDRISILHRKHQGWRPTVWSEGQLSKAGHPAPYHCGLTAWPSRSSRTTISQLDLFVRLLFGALGSQIALTATSSLPFRRPGSIAGHRVQRGVHGERMSGSFERPKRPSRLGIERVCAAVRGRLPETHSLMA